MSGVSSIRIPGLATGMDTDNMIKEMLTGEQSKVDKVKQKGQTIKWQQEIYRDVIKDVKGLYDKYFSATSKDYIMSSKAFSTVKINSSNPSILTATSSAGADNINYKFQVDKIAEPPKFISSKVGMTRTSNIVDLGLDLGTETSRTFKISLGNDKYSKDITINTDDTIDSMIKKINDSTSGDIKASFSEMSGQFILQGTKTGASSSIQIVDTNGNPSTALGFLGIDEVIKQGSNSDITVMSSDGIVIKTINNQSNSFIIDNITYNVNGIGATSLTSEINTQNTVDKMKAFIGDYNKIMDKTYDTVTEKKNKDYPPLTEAQKKDMEEEEIKQWEEKSKQGLLRNDRELRKFIDDIKQALVVPIDGMGISLADIGITSSKNYNEQGQIYLDEEKFAKALRENGDKVYRALTDSNNGAFEKIKNVIYDYAGSSTSIFVKKAGIEKSSATLNNLYSEQLKKQEELIKNLQRKMDDKEKELYKRFAKLESSMNKFNSQMNYLSQQSQM
jgi:flagellar capping protein FliD